MKKNLALILAIILVASAGLIIASRLSAQAQLRNIDRQMRANFSHLQKALLVKVWENKSAPAQALETNINQALYERARTLAHKANISINSQGMALVYFYKDGQNTMRGFIPYGCAWLKTARGIN